MANKKHILNHLSSYTAHDIAKYVSDGTITLSDIKFACSPKKYFEIENIAKHPEIYLETTDTQTSTQQPQVPNVQAKEEQKSNKKHFFTTFFSFNGRICRCEYNLTILYITYPISILYAMLIDYSAMSKNGTSIYCIAFVFTFFLLWLLLAQGCKRCHDIGCNGWLQIIIFISPITILLLMLKKGEPGRNKFGDLPKTLL